MGGMFHNSVRDKHSGSFSSVSLPRVRDVTRTRYLCQLHSAAASSADLAFPTQRGPKTSYGSAALTWVQDPHDSQATLSLPVTNDDKEQYCGATSCI